MKSSNLRRCSSLHYRDSGMMGSETSEDERCLWATWNREPESVTKRVVEVIREIRPQVVITFNKYGGYGHPDHIAIQRATTEAFKLAGDVKLPDRWAAGISTTEVILFSYSSIHAQVVIVH